MKIIITLLLVINVMIMEAQQDPQYSQYQFNQMIINPAYAGGRDALSVVVDIRNQWGGFSGAPRTQAFSLHGPLKKKRIGLGLSGYSDQIGPQSTVGFYGSFAYILPLSNKLKLSFGLRAGFVSNTFAWDKLNYENANETKVVTSLQQQHTNADIDAGLYLKSNSFYCGLSATHINSAKIYDEQLTSFSSGNVFNFKYTMAPHLFFIISKGFKAGENVIINPTMMIKTTKGVASTDLNINFLIKKRFWVGAFARTGKTVGLLAQVYVTDKLRIGYSFDRSLNKTQNQLGSGHEIMIGFDFNTFKSAMLSPRYL